MTDDEMVLVEIAAWYRGVLGSYPEGPDREAKALLLDLAERAVAGSAKARWRRRAVASEWARVLLILAEAEREAGWPGWRTEWTGAYETAMDGA